jgi:hypothetical protein
MGANSSVKKILLGLGVLLLGALLFYYRSGPSRAGDIPENQPLSSVIESAPSKAPSSVSQVSTVTAKDYSAGMTSEEKKTWDEFQDILQSTGDNDPRLDKDFHKMSEHLKAALRSEYQNLPMEQRNQRGLIAFLIARDLQSVDDLHFLRSVYEETPCLSMENCSSTGSSDPHHAGVDQVSANYPQLAGLYQLEKYLASNDPRLREDSAWQDQVKEVLQQAARFPVPSVQRKAEDIRQHLNP